MKNYIFLTVTLLAVIFTVTNSYGQTTQEEYNYITKGYKVQMESGLDMKKGYSFIEFGNWGLKHGIENRQCEFIGLVRQGHTKPCAIMMIYKRTDITNGATFYICIPSADAPQEIWNQTLDFINTSFKDNNALQNTIIWALMHFSSQEASN
jgi:hypothetical protein